jgi:hypothetical protein
MQIAAGFDIRLIQYLTEWQQSDSNLRTYMPIGPCNISIQKYLVLMLIVMDHPGCHGW